MINWQDINYLKSGNEKQQRAYNCLKNLQLLEKLSSFNSILVGTIPIEIDIATSDLDVVCQYSNQAEFATCVKENFEEQTDFTLHSTQDYLVASFVAYDFAIEIYGEKHSVFEQNAFRHMVIEHRLLTLASAHFKEQIIALKEKGVKTEPAFGQLLGLANPYVDLLGLEVKSDEELEKLLKCKGFLK